MFPSHPLLFPNTVTVANELNKKVFREIRSWRREVV
jgi:hypothetical protein